MRKKGFTLIELLVVIAVVGLLISIMVPALNRGKELAKRLICMTHLRSIGLANNLYTNDHDGWYVPVLYHLPNEPITAFHAWPDNKIFRELLGYADAQTEYDSEGNEQWNAPKEFLCPSDKVSLNKMTESLYTSWLSYGGNITDWDLGQFNWDDILYAGHRSGNVRNPSNELSFSESNDWWMWWRGANYEIGWDVFGHDTISVYHTVINGPTFYRHSEGANILFYDGHVDWLRKEKVFIIEDWEATPQKPGIWSIYPTFPPPVRS